MSFCRRTLFICLNNFQERTFLSKLIYASPVGISKNRICRYEPQICNNDRHRSFSTSRHTMFRGSNQTFVKLMEFPKIRQPNAPFLFHKYPLEWLIRSKYEQTFTFKSFLEGAIQAIVVVSHFISVGNFEALEGLVTSNAISEIRRNFQYLSPETKRDIPVKEDRIAKSYIYDVKSSMIGETEKCLVEVTVVLHVISKEFMDEADTKEFSFAGLMNFVEKMQICNYRFFKEFTKDSDSEWMIDVANHFKAVEEDN